LYGIRKWAGAGKSRIKRGGPQREPPLFLMPQPTRRLGYGR